METFTSSSRMDLSCAADFSPVPPHVISHLQRVYTSLAMGVVAAAAGSIVPVYFPFLHLPGFLTFLGALVCMFMLKATPHTEDNLGKRFSFFLGFCGLQGLSLNPLLSHVIEVDPSIVTTALVGTCAVFACFSGAALMAKDRSFLYLGGILSSALTLMMVMSVINIFFRSAEIAMGVQVYFGLLVFTGFVVFDTQMIIARNKLGDNDFIWHGLELFLDFINIFIRLVIILSRNADKKKESKRR